MRSWPTTTIPLNKGIDEGSATNSPKLQVTTASNVDFSIENAIKPRPAYKPVEVFNQKYTTATGLLASQQVSDRLSLVNMDTAPLGTFTCRDALGEYPGLILRGSIFVYGSEWSDKGGCALVNSSRLWESRHDIYPGGNDAGAPALSPTAGGSAAYVLASSYNFAFTDTNEITLYDAGGSTGTVVNSGYPAGAGCGAVCKTGASASTMMVHVPAGTNQLVLTTRFSSSPDFITQTLLKTDARTPKGVGDNPCISCDQDETHCYIAYFSNANLTSLHILRVTILTGVITHTIAPVSAGAGVPLSLWITNSSVAGNRVAVSMTSTVVGDYTDIYNSTTMVSTGFSSLVAHASPLTACGAIDVANGYFYLVNTDVLGAVSVYRRYLTSTSLTRLLNWLGGGGYGVFSTMPSWYIQHQPIRINNSVFITLTKAPGWDNINLAQACTWMTIDVGSMVDSSQVPKAGTLKFKVVAQGPGDGTMQPFNPVSAMTLLGNNYRFQSVDWAGFRAGSGPLHTKLSGFSGTLGMNQLSQVATQYAHSAESTVLAGSVMRSIARGDAEELGFTEGYPWCDINFPTPGGPTSIAIGDYTACAVWRWTDSSGQVHRSAPSPFFTANNSAINNRIVFTVTPPYCTEKDNVFTEIYVTTASPVGVASHYMQGMLYPGTTTFAIAAVDNLGEILYTDGNVLENQCPSASGGCVTVGTRTWISDGRAVYASKLPAQKTMTQWNFDDPLTVRVPGSAGVITGLASIDDKLIILCRRGVYAVTGSGPDDTGVGTGFSDPVRVSELGLDNSRLVQSTPDAIVFLSNSTSTNEVGGLYSIDNGLHVTYLSQAVKDFIGSNTIYDMYWWADRQQLLLANADGTMVFDARSKQWATWLVQTGGIQQYITSSNGVLWMVDDESQGRFGIVPDGNDQTVSGTLVPYSMGVVISPVPVGDDMFTWGRVRGVMVLQNPVYSPANYTLNMNLIPDNGPVYSCTPIVVSTSTSPTGWPSSPTPEWRFPVQKMTYFSIQLSATPAIPTWTALSFAHRKIGNVPTKQRV